MKDKMVVMGKWLEIIKKRASKEQYDAICGRLLDYGIFGEYQESGDAFIDSQLDWILPQIDLMQDKYDSLVELGGKGGRPVTVDNKRIWQLAREGKNGTVIAKMLEVPKSTVYSSEGWRNRKNSDFL